MNKKLKSTGTIQITYKQTIVLLMFTLFVFCPVYVYNYWHLTNLKDLFQGMIYIYFISCIGTLLFAIFTKLIISIWHWLDHDAIQNRLRIWSYRLCEWCRSRNSKTIYPRLQNFIFYVMNKNKEQFPLPVGNDISCLTPYGMMYTYRHSCVFYRFQLVVPDTPDLPVTHLKRLLQHYITTESRNYGIVGLYNTYEDFRHNVWDSIYVDQMALDEENHILSFDILYVSSEKASNYMILAMQLEQPSSNNMQEVYDDEV